MWKRTVGLGLVAGLAILAVTSGGCSSDLLPPKEQADAAYDSAPDEGPRPPEHYPSWPCPTVAVLTKADVERRPFGAWKPARETQDVCTQADIAAFEANFVGAKEYVDLIDGLPPACAACILNKEFDALWSFVVTDHRGELGFLNYGACYARASGSDACGKAVHSKLRCVTASCADCNSATEATACENDPVTATNCASFGGDIETGCGTDQAKIAALDAACSKAGSAVAVLCGSEVAADAGGD